MSVVASAWFDGQHVPQDLVTGVLVTLIGLLILFAIKPRLTVALDIYRPAQGEPAKPAYGFRVTNAGRAPVIEIKARLFRVDTNSRPPAREPVALKTDELFQLPGRWARNRRRPASYGSLDSFRFLIGDTHVAPALSRGEYLLFQVSSKHAFTNFSRVALQRWVWRDGKLEPWDGRGNPWDEADEPPDPPDADR